MGILRWRRAGTVAAGVIVGLAGGAVTWAALSGPGQPPPAPGVHARTAVESHHPAPPRQSPRHTSPAGPGHGVADRISGPALSESKPVSVAIPRLHVSSRLVELGIDTTGAMQVPEDPAVAGWYGRGPTPGALGPAVIAGHVTWNRVPAVFFRLGTMRRGDVVDVVRDDGTRARFSVTRVASFGKASFPTRAVYGNIDHAGLRLITCGGRYDLADHRYLANVVVFARLAAQLPTAHAGR